MSDSAISTIRTTNPARLDRLNWTPFHTRMVAGLGAAWVLDGLQGKSLEEVTKPITSVDAAA